MAEIRIGPSGLPVAASFEEAAGALVAAGYRAVEVGFVSGFWLGVKGVPSGSSPRTPGCDTPSLKPKCSCPRSGPVSACLVSAGPDGAGPVGANPPQAPVRHVVTVGIW